MHCENAITTKVRHLPLRLFGSLHLGLCRSGRLRLGLFRRWNLLNFVVIVIYSLNRGLPRWRHRVRLMKLMQLLMERLVF